MAIEVTGGAAADPEAEAQAEPIYTAVMRELGRLSYRQRLAIAGDLNNGTPWDDVPPARRAPWVRVAERLEE